ncbi:MAG: four helix bundle protein [Candidatus Aminicenantes bacterium]|nr:four helix bundle protein [Candidatus Aminicenantes bacterium]
MLAKSKTFEDLIVWQKAHEFVLQIYEYTARFPKHELFGLSSQFRRAAVSIPANIAEGFRKNGLKDKIRFYNIAEGSINECFYYLRLSSDLKYGENSIIQTLLVEVSKLLQAYSKNVIPSSY